MEQDELLQRITVDPAIPGGKPIVRGRRLAVEHVLGMLAAGDSFETILECYPGSSPRTSRPAWSTRTASWATSASNLDPRGSSPSAQAGCDYDPRRDCGGTWRLR